ncbi:unnamed protein product [Caenorhabditis angaria]|uniref:DUF38 domain-containing protein n=1 Tax=Caenorhabditis angaria TaxID=860376 RepID=A0A9P1IN26_9PELO|nr:unnamed protein product [Caenorhabditis angaria]
MLQLVFYLILPILTSSSDPNHQNLAKSLAQLTETALTQPTRENCKKIYNDHILFSGLRDKKLEKIGNYIENSASNQDKWSGEKVSQDIEPVSWNMVKNDVFWVDFVVDQKANRSIWAKKSGDNWKVYYVHS